MAPSSLPQEHGRAAAVQGRPCSDGDVRNSTVISSRLSICARGDERGTPRDSSQWNGFVS